jgi:hypothetical protein
VVAPITKRHYRLEEVVASITRKNLHGEVPAGDAQGREPRRPYGLPTRHE